MIGNILNPTHLLLVLAVALLRSMRVCLPSPHIRHPASPLAAHAGESPSPPCDSCGQRI